MEVFMKTLFISGNYMVLQGCYTDGGERECYVQLRVLTDGLRLFVKLLPMPYLGFSYGFGISVPVTYNGVKKNIAAEVFDSEAGVEFDYSDGVKEITFGCQVKYRADAYSSPFILKWKGSAADPAPAMDFRCYGVRLKDSITLYWDITAPEGYYGCLMAVYEITFRSRIDGTYRRTFVVNRKQTVSGSYAVHLPCDLNDTCEYRAYAALYDSPDADADDYVGIVEVCTPEFTVMPAYTLYPPYNLVYGRATAGAVLRLSWEPAVESLQMRSVTYELERSVNGGAYSLIYSGESTAFADTPGRDWGDVVYRVRAVPVGSAYGKTSWWTIGRKAGVVQTNIYVGTDSGIKPAAGVYIGNNLAVPTFFCGG